MKIKYIPLLLALLLLLTGCGARQPEATRQIFAMDTVMDFYAVGEGAEDTLTAAAQEINRLEGLLSRTRAGSEVDALNRHGSVVLSDETAALLRSALHYADVTGGAFDVTIAPLVEAWNIHGENPRVLTDSEIAALEEQIARCEEEQNHCGSDYVKLQSLQEEQAELEGKLEQKMERWMYLTELKERIDAQ